MPGPNIRLTKSGDVITKLTIEAEQVKKTYKARPTILPPPIIRSPEDVERRARQRLRISGVANPDEITVLGELWIQRGQYRGKTFRWLMENDPGYGFYLWREHEKGPSPGKTKEEVDRATANVSSLVNYMKKVPACVTAHQNKVTSIQADKKAKETGDASLNVLGFGRFHTMTYGDVTKSTDKEHQKYCRWILGKKNVMQGSSMHRFQVHLQGLPSSSATTSPDTPTQPSTSTQKTAPPKATQQDQTTSSKPTIVSPEAPAGEEVATTATDLSWQRFVSPVQEMWMRKELQKLGLLPGTVEYLQPSRWQGQPLWRTPPPGELQSRPANQLPKPDDFWLHPMFVWSPETMCQQLMGTAQLPCITASCTGRAEKRGIGKPRVVVGTGGGSSGMPNTGQYYILASTLYCSKCKCSPWASDQPSYLQMLPKALQNLFPAVVTYRKAVCKSLVDQIRRSGRSPSDSCKEIQELLQLRFERAHNQYLTLLKIVRGQARTRASLDAASGLNYAGPSAPFGKYENPTGYRGVTISEQFLANVLINEYNEQKPYLYGHLKGVFGKYWRSDHTRTLAQKVELLSGVMWSFCTFNEFWEVVSWVMVDSDSEMSLNKYYQGLSQRYKMAAVDKAAVRWIDKWCCVAPPYTSSGSDKLQKAEVSLPPGKGPNSAGVEVLVDRSTVTRNSACRNNFNNDIVELLDSFHCLRRFAKACTSAAHPAYPRFMGLLSSAFFIIDEEDMQNLRSARAAIGAKGDPTKKQIRKHCRTVIPAPEQLEKRVHAVIQSFEDVTDANGILLFKQNMTSEWHLQRTHIRRGCLSDPYIHPVDGSEDVTNQAGGVLYRLVDYVHLGGVKSPATRLPVWQPLRGTSQLEGFHPHQARWVTGTRVSPALFQAQAFLGLTHWNWKRAIEHRHLTLPAFDPKLTSELNNIHQHEYGHPKYPDFSCSDNHTGENFGMDYSDEDMSTRDEEQVHMVPVTTTEDEPTPDASYFTSFDCSVDAEAQKEVEEMISSQEVKTQESVPGPSGTAQLTKSKPPVVGLKLSTLSGMVTNWHPDKWTPFMVSTINNLLAKHTGKERMERVLKEYRQLVYASAGEDANQLRMTNRHFIQLYERTVNRRLEGQAAVNYSEDQTRVVEELSSRLTETREVPAHVVQPLHSQPQVNVHQVPPPDDPMESLKRRQETSSSSSSDEDSTQSPSAASPDVVSNLAQAIMETIKSKKKAKKAKKAKKRRSDPRDEPSGSRGAGRLCSICGKPKSRIKGPGNLHYTYVRKGQPAFFYCPQKYSALYGTSLTMTFDEFKASEYWLPAMQEVQRNKDQKERLKAEAQQKRAEKGWKKPGGPRKSSDR